MSPTVEDRLGAPEERIGRLADTLGTVEMTADMALRVVNQVSREQRWADGAIRDRRSGLHGHVTGIHAKLDQLIEAVRGQAAP
jgi:hypothetical protein